MVSRFKDGAIADNDYSKLEVILFAWTAKEWKLLEFFLEGNGYIAVGKELFGKEVEDGTDEYRVIKSIVLGIQYGMGACKLAYQLWNNVGVKLSADWESHVAMAASLRERYLQKFPGIARYMYMQRQALIKNQDVLELDQRLAVPVEPLLDEQAAGHSGRRSSSSSPWLRPPRPLAIRSRTWCAKCFGRCSSNGLTSICLR